MQKLATRYRHVSTIYCSSRGTIEIANSLQGTTSVGMYSFNYYSPTGGVTRVHLVDTPGFNDLRRTNIEILQELVYWLSQSYDKGFFLDGILYLHNILAPRFEGSTRQSFEIMKAIVGQRNYNCVYLAATFWDEALSRGKPQFHEASNRHDELEDQFWQPMIDEGAQMCLPPDDETTELTGYGWAKGMIEYFVRKGTKHQLLIQTELSSPYMQISDTSAGKLAQDLWEEDMTHQTRILQLQKTKAQLITEWSDHIKTDMLHFKQEIDSLNKQIVQRRPPSCQQLQSYGMSSQIHQLSFQYQPVNQAFMDYYTILRQRKEDLDKEKMLKIASHGYRVNVGSASFGLGSLVFGGISAAAALGACVVM